jgi:hypothetical protein
MGTRSDEIHPIIPPWSLAPLRPKRAASGVAGLSYGCARQTMLYCRKRRRANLCAKLEGVQR